MDSQRFDQLAKALATGASRRQAVRALAGGLAALGAAALGREPAGAGDDRRCFPGENACRERRAVLCGGGTLRRPCLCFVGTDKAICGDASPGRCVRCRTDRDCRAKTGRGSVCIKVEGQCGCQPGFTGRRACVAPCPR